MHSHCGKPLPSWKSSLVTRLGWTLDVTVGLKLVAYTGGPYLSCGEALAKRLLPLFTDADSIEGGGGRCISSCDSSHWDSFKFVVGQQMEGVATGIQELVFPRTELATKTCSFSHTRPHSGVKSGISDLVLPRGGWEWRVEI